MKEKIIFWLGNDYTHYCLAYHLQKKIDADFFAIVETTNRPKKFFQNQKLVDFKETWFLHDHIKKRSENSNLNYLSEIEKKYKVDLWKLIQNERIFLYYKNFHDFSSDQMLGILSDECKFFDQILTQIKPSFFFTKISSLHHQELFFQMCKNSGVKTQVLTYAPLGQHCFISKEPLKFDHNEDLTNIKDKNRSFKELQEYLKSFNLVKQLDDKIIKPGTTKMELFKAAKEFVFHTDSENTKTHYTYYGRTKFKVLLYYLDDYIKTKKRMKFVNRNLAKDVKITEPFVFFPLHTEIERSLLIAAPFYTNQIEVIKWIAKAIPINFKLVVKEHPAQIKRAWRSEEDYKQIMNIPNVVLVHPNVSNEILYKNCSLVFTIAGTPGFEALFYGKPVITFEEMYYSILPSVNMVKNLDELPDLIKKSIIQKVESTHLDRYISLLEKNLVKFDYANFMARLSNEFFYGSNLVDVDISETKMQKFLQENGTSLIPLIEAHIEKIHR